MIDIAVVIYSYLNFSNRGFKQLDYGCIVTYYLFLLQGVLKWHVFNTNTVLQDLIAL